MGIGARLFALGGQPRGERPRGGQPRGGQPRGEQPRGGLCRGGQRLAAWGLAALGASAVLGAVGCAGPVGPRGEATPLGVVSFDAEGRSAPIARPVDGPIAVWTTADPDTCFALEGADAARGGALDVVEGSGPLRFQRVRCATGTPLRAPLADALEVAWSPVARPTEGRLALRFVVTDRSVMQDQPEARATLVDALAAELAPLGLTPEVQVVEVAGAPAESRFGDREAGSLDALLALAPPAPAATIDVVFAGCLRRVDPLGTPGAVLGVTGRVGGGGGGAADAVFLPGRVCDAFDDAPAPVDPRATAHVLAHELGHFLGLAHVDDEANLMHPQPQRATARELSREQARVVSLHPFVR